MGRLLRKLFLGVVLNSIAILVCVKIFNYLWNDFFFNGSAAQLIIFAFILTLLNLLLKPIIRLIFLPLIWITLGIFSLIINLIILKTAALLMPGILVITSLLTWFAASIVISIFNAFVSRIK